MNIYISFHLENDSDFIAHNKFYKMLYLLPATKLSNIADGVSQASTS